MMRDAQMRWKLGGEVPGQEFVDTVNRMIGGSSFWETYCDRLNA